MIFLDNNQNSINELVLRSKIGERDSRETLWKSHKFIINDIFRGITKFYPFLKDNKLDIYHDYYLLFWEAINSYDFDSETSFSYYAKEYIINETKRDLQEKYCIPIEKQPSNAEIKDCGVAKKRESINTKDREIVLKGMKTLSIRQKQAIFIHFFFCATTRKGAKFLKLYQPDLLILLKRGYKGIRNTNWGKKRGKKGVFREKVYRVYKLDSLKFNRSVSHD